MHSFNVLFFGDKEHGQPIRLIPPELFGPVKNEHQNAMLDPVKYMQEFNYKQPVSIPQLVAIHCILSEYDVEGEQLLSCMARDGSIRTIPMTLATSTTKSLISKSADTIYDKYIDKYVNSVQCLINKKMHNQQDIIHDYIDHKIDTLHEVQYINKLAVVNGEVVEDVAQTPVCLDKEKEEAE